MRGIRKTKPRQGIPGYRLYYADKPQGRQRDGVICSRVLRSAKYGLSGKPDLIYKKGKRLIPVELKSGSQGHASAPRPGDLMQLAAYFFILKGEFGIKPRQGRLVYGDCMFIIKNRWSLRRRLLKTMARMRRALDAGDDGAEGAEASFPKCKSCVCRETVCALWPRSDE